MDIKAPQVRNNAGSIASQISCHKANDGPPCWQQLQIKTQHCCHFPKSHFTGQWAAEAVTWPSCCAKECSCTHSLQLPSTDAIYLPPSVASAKISCRNWVGASILQKIIQEIWGKSSS